MKKIVGLAVSALLVGCSAAGDDGVGAERTGESAQAILTYEPWTNIRLVGENLCLAAVGTSAPPMALTYGPCDGAGPRQLFQRAGGKLVGWTETCVDNRSPGARHGVVLSGCVNNWSEQWFQDGNGQLHVNGENDACLAFFGPAPLVGTSSVETEACDPSKLNEDFEFVQLPYTIIRDAFITMHGRCLDNNGPNFQQGAQLQTWDCNWSGAQRFEWQHANNNQIQDMTSKLCLDIFAFDNSNGAVVDEWPCNGLPNQSWSLTVDGQVVSNWNGKCLDAASYSLLNGSRVQMWDCYGGLNQSWTHVE